MWWKPGGRPLRFTAVEEFAGDEVAFSWRARFPMIPFVSLHVVDRHKAGDGFLEARAPGTRAGSAPARTATQPGRGDALPRRARLGPARDSSQPPARVARARRSDGRSCHVRRIGESRSPPRLRRRRRNRRLLLERPPASGGQDERAETVGWRLATTTSSAASGFRRAARCAGSLQEGPFTDWRLAGKDHVTRAAPRCGFAGESVAGTDAESRRRGQDQASNDRRASPNRRLRDLTEVVPEGPASGPRFASTLLRRGS